MWHWDRRNAWHPAPLGYVRQCRRRCDIPRSRMLLPRRGGSCACYAANREPGERCCCMLCAGVRATHTHTCNRMHTMASSAGRRVQGRRGTGREREGGREGGGCVPLTSATHGSQAHFAPPAAPHCTALLVTAMAVAPVVAYSTRGSHAPCHAMCCPSPPAFWPGRSCATYAATYCLPPQLPADMHPVALCWPRPAAQEAQAPGAAPPLARGPARH